MITPHPWNELEQRFLRFTNTLSELLESVLVVVDDDRAHAEVTDSVSNIVIGAKGYITACENEIATAMEQKINHDYKSGSYKQTTGILFINDDWTIQLPRYGAELVNWEPGDKLKWEVKDDNTVLVRKVD